MGIQGTVHVISGESNRYATDFLRWCSKIKEVNDKSLRDVFKKDPTFEATPRISKHLPGPCAIHCDDDVAYFLVLGTTDQVFKRLVSAYHHASEHILFIIQSDAEAWWRENRHKSQWKNSDGNRVSLSKLLDVMSTIDKWDGWPPNISILELSTPEAMKAWSSHLGVG